MNIIQHVVFLCFFVVFVDSAERVRRDVGNSCPRNIQWQKGKNCRQNRCVKYRRKGTVAVLRCPRGFGRYGNKQLVCGKDGAWRGEFPICVKSGCSPIDTSNDLNLVMSLHPKFDDAVITFTCEDESIMFGPPEIHCDGVKWSSLPPRCEAITDLVSCDFEEDMCGWTQDFTVHGNQNWTRDIGPTMTGGTGPKRDHTSPHSDTGHYMYFETSAPIQEGDKGILISPMYPADFSPMCFEFWYHMLGPDDQGHVGSLDVYVKAESDQFEFLQPEFHKEGNQKDIWHKGDIFIDGQIESYQILIVATKKKSYMSDIAIDDVRLHNCTQTTTTTTTTITSTIPISVTQSSTSPTTSSEPSTTVANGNATSSRSIVTTTVMSNTSGTPAIIITTISDANTTDVMVSQTTLALTGISTNKTAITSTAVKPTSESPIETTALSLNTTTASPPIVTTTSIKRTSTATQTTNRPTTTPTTLLPSTTSTSTKVPVSSTTTTSTTVATTPIATVQSSSPKTTTLPTTTQAVSTKASTTTPPPTSTIKLTTRPSTQTTSSTLRTTVQTMPITSKIASSAPTTLSKSPAVSRSSTSSGISSTPQTSQPSSNGPSKRSSLTSTKTVTLTPPRVTESTKTPEQNRSELVTTTAKQVDKTKNNDKDSNATAKAAISTHPEDDTLKPLMIGLGVGIIVGLIIIGIIVWACMRKRKFYTSRYEDELKPITNAASTQSLNNVEYYQDDFDIEHIQ